MGKAVSIYTCLSKHGDENGKRLEITCVNYTKSVCVCREMTGHHGTIFSKFLFPFSFYFSAVYDIILSAICFFNYL